MTVHTQPYWTPYEDEVLLALVERKPWLGWLNVSRQIRGRNEGACQRRHSLLKSGGLKRKFYNVPNDAAYEPQRPICDIYHVEQVILAGGFCRHLTHPDTGHLTPYLADMNDNLVGRRERAA